MLGNALFGPALIQAQIRTGSQSAKISSPESFRQTVRKAGLIFDGTVTAVARETGIAGAPLACRISFHVKQGIRGVRTGSAVTIREWAGLWTGTDTHEPRYRVDERSVFFFYPPRPGGLTSPVGSRGKLAVDRAGRVALPTEWVAGDLSINDLSFNDPSIKVHNGASSVATRSAVSRILVRVLAEQIRLAEAN
jgi:hypothetical protein